MKTTLVVLASVLIVLSMAAVYAATQQTVTATVSVNGAVSITLNNAALTFNNVNADGSDNTPTENPITATVSSNTGYSVKVQATQANFNGPVSTLAASNLRWSSTVAGTYIGYTTSAATVGTGSSGGGSQTIYHKLSIPTGTIAGTYNLPITVSVTTP